MEHEAMHLLLMTVTVAAAGGMALIMVADRLRLPSIGFLLLGGILFGPEVMNIARPQDMGAGLQTFVAIAVAIILFEGSIGLNFKAIRNTPGDIRGILTIGTLVTWVGSAIVIRFVCDVPWDVAILCGSMIIVSGPTVIGPLLQKVKVRQKLRHLLHWEGVLIDPIGVFAALLTFEFLMHEGSALSHLAVFTGRIVIGVTLGLAGGWLMEQAFLRKIMHKSVYNVFFLAFAIMLFTISDLMISEAGILTVVVAGSWLAYRIGDKLKGVVHFHEEIVRLIAGMVFILLSANLKLSGFAEVGFEGLVAIGLILLLVRPANIFLSTLFGSNLDLREKLFLSWLNPRGIIAASMASLFALIMTHDGNPHSTFLESFVYMVIITTVLVHGFGTGLVARLLRVEEEPRTDWLVVGNSPLAYGLCRFIQAAGFKVMMMDKDVNYDLYQATDKFELIHTDPIDPDILQDPRFDKVGHVIAATDQRDFNALTCQMWIQDTLDVSATYYLCTEPLMTLAARPIVIPGQSLSQINHEMLLGHLSIANYHTDEMEFREIFRTEGELLLMRTKDTMIPPDMQLLEQTQEALFLVYHRIPLTQFLRPNLVFTKVPTSNVVYFLINCVELVVNNSNFILTHKLEQLLLKSEPLRSSVLSNGIAVPRVFSPEVLEPVVAVFQIPEGIEYVPMSKKMTHLVFLAILPEARMNLMEDIIKEIEALRDNQEHMDKLLKARNASELFLLLHDPTAEIDFSTSTKAEDSDDTGERIDQNDIDSLFD